MLGVGLWRVADPGNVGAVVRTAGAFEASVALSDGCADPTSPRAVRASAGAIFRVPLAGFDAATGRSVALVAHGGRPLAEVSLEQPLTLVLGAERVGLLEDVVAHATRLRHPDFRRRRVVERGGDRRNRALRR